MPTTEDLRQLQELPLESKIQLTLSKIYEYYTHEQGNVYISFSGGKDSAVLLHIVREYAKDIFPEFTKLPAVFDNTGLEYPEIQKFVKTFENVVEIRPNLSFPEVITKYGYPVISKEVSTNIFYSRKGNQTRLLRLHGGLIDKNGDKSRFNCDKYLPLFNLPFKISSDCCRVMKKIPFKSYERKTKTHVITGEQAEESRNRKMHWLKGGCNFYDGERIVSHPMSFWTLQDILQYIKKYNVEICSVYGDVDYLDEKKEKLCCTKCQRTGCLFCAFGVHLETGETRFQRLAETHPKQYEYCINGGKWIENSEYDEECNSESVWNPQKIWVPSKDGLGLGNVFDMINAIYGKEFIKYE